MRARDSFNLTGHNDGLSETHHSRQRGTPARTIPFGPITDLEFPGSIDVWPSTLILVVKEA
jgi:hypothetical protein